MAPFPWLNLVLLANLLGFSGLIIYDFRGHQPGSLWDSDTECKVPYNVVLEVNSYVYNSCMWMN